MKNPGLLVITKSGKKGRTINTDPIINGKVRVYLESSEHVYDGGNILCEDGTLTVIGFID